MSESKEHFHRDFSKFDEMSTAELNEILRQDSQLPDGEESDIDAILYIMEVIEKRSQELPLSDFKDVDRAWSSFNENYRFASSDERSLFDLDDEPQQNSTSDKMQILQPAPRSNARSHSRYPCGSYCSSSGDLFDSLCIGVRLVGGNRQLDKRDIWFQVRRIHTNCCDFFQKRDSRVADLYCQ